MTATVLTEDLKNLYAEEYDYVQDYQEWAKGAALVEDDYGDNIPTNLQASPYWGANMPYSEQVTLALRLGYYEALLSNTIDGNRFQVSSYYRLGQILGTMAAKGIIPHDSWKDIVWIVDDLTGFKKSLPLGTETLKVAKQIAAEITGNDEEDLDLYYA
jgi:hypothetical protein